MPYQHASRVEHRCAHACRPRWPDESRVVMQLGFEAFGAFRVGQVLHVAVQLTRAGGRSRLSLCIEWKRKEFAARIVEICND